MPRPGFEPRSLPRKGKMIDRTTPTGQNEAIKPVSKEFVSFDILMFLIFRLFCSKKFVFENFSAYNLDYTQIFMNWSPYMANKKMFCVML